MSISNVSMSMQNVNNLDNALGTLQSIKGDVTSGQLNELVSLFSTKIYNTADVAGTTQTIERQIKDLEMLLEELDAKIAKLYDEQKDANRELNNLINDLNENQFNVTNQSKKVEQQQIDLVSKSTDDAYNEYMKGNITKDEIPMYIASLIQKGNPSGAAALESALGSLNSKGEAITNLSNKITGILDNLNEYKAQYKTTKTSMDLLAKLKANIPQHKDRADIQGTLSQQYFTPSQEALGDKLIDQFKVAAGGNDKFSMENPAVKSLSDALKGGGAVNAEKKAQIDAMTPEDRAAAVETADLTQYSALELMYMSGMDATQAAYAIGHIFEGSKAGYDATDGSLVVPFGHGDGAVKAYKNLKNQYKTLWGDGKVKEGSVDEKGDKVAGADPIGWREGNTNFMFAVDRDNDNIFDGADEFLGAKNGWDELVAFDTDKDGKVTADEAEAGGLMVVQVNQELTGGGQYGFNSAAAEGFESLDLNSYKEISQLKQENLNGNTRVGEFNLVVDGAATLGKQTLNNETYNELFYGHMYGEAYSFGLDPNEVASALTTAAENKDYMANERAAVENKVSDIDDSINNTAANVENNLANAEAATNNIYAPHVSDKDEDEETATNTNDSTASTSTTTSADTSSASVNKVIPEV